MNSMEKRKRIRQLENEIAELKNEPKIFDVEVWISGVIAKNVEEVEKIIEKLIKIGPNVRGPISIAFIEEVDKGNEGD